MAHHGDNPFGAYDDDTRRRMEEIFKGPSALGPTGASPQGKISDDDEGEVALAVGHKMGQVVIDFGGPVAWVGMNPQQAIAFANSIIDHAKKARIIGADRTETRHKVAVKEKS